MIPVVRRQIVTIDGLPSIFFFSSVSSASSIRFNYENLLDLVAIFDQDVLQYYGG